MQKPKIKLRTILMLSFSILIFIPILAISIFSYRNQYKSLKASTNEVLIKGNNSISDSITYTYINNKETIDMFSTNINVVGVAENPEWEEFMLSTFNDYIKSHNNARAIFYGQVTKKHHSTTGKPKPGYDPTKRPWYKKSIENPGQAIITNPYEDTNKKGLYVVTIAKTVKKPDSGEILGVIGMDITLDDISNNVNEIKIGDSGYAAIIDNKGTIIAHKNTSLVGNNAKDIPYFNDIINSKDNMLTEDVEGDSTFVYKSQNFNTGWNIVSFVSRKEINKKINSSLYTTIIIALICMAVAFFISLYLAKYIVNFIKDIVEILNAASKGDLTKKAKLSKKDPLEIFLIKKELNEMIGSMINIIREINCAGKTLNETSQQFCAMTAESNVAGGQITRAIQQITDGTTNQVDNLEISLLQVDKLSTFVEDTASNADLMESSSTNVIEEISNGTESIELLKEDFEHTLASNDLLYKEANILKDNSSEIVTITNSLKAITQQTNLLALNASIEAARAGEQGKGFAVVAEEVRKLAEQSSMFAEDIEKVINSIITSINTVMQRVTSTKQLGETTNDKLNSTNNSFIAIEDTINELKDRIDKAVESINNVNETKAIVISKIEEISAITEETSATTEEVSASVQEQEVSLNEIVKSSENLYKLAEQLDNSISIFKVSE